MLASIFSHIHQDASDSRIALSVCNVTANGFEIELSTWLDSQIWSSEVSWIAFDNSFLSGAHGMCIMKVECPVGAVIQQQIVI